MKKVTRIVFVLDRSGSMQPIMRHAIKAINENIAMIKQSVLETDQDATVSLVVFDDEVEPRFINRSISAVSSIDENSIPTRGMTALRDATGFAIEQMLAVPVGVDEDVSYLLNVVTDGEENKSKKFSSKALTDLMKKVQATDLWTLTFLVPPGNTRVLTAQGIPDGNVMEWSASVKGVQAYAAANNSAFKNYFVARSTGVKNVKTFYTNLSSVSLNDVKDNLVDLSSKMIELNVGDHENDVQIKDLIESRGLHFEKGCAFYQLLPKKKTADKVQDYKKVMIMGTDGKIYGGDQARAMLGLPNHETSIRPGDHGNFKIFVQSTSVNRKVKAGSKVLYQRL